MKFHNLPIALFLLASLSTAHASTPHAASREGWRVFGGIGVGYGAVGGAEFGSNPRGEQYLLGADISLNTSHWVGEVGLGWLYSRLRGSLVDDSNVLIRTRSGFADLSVRYRLSDRWQLGPVLALTFGTDTSQAPSVSSARSSYLFGIKSAYEIPWGGNPVRFWQQLAIDVSIPHYRYLVGMMGIQVGLPLGVAGSKARSKPSDVIQMSRAAPEKVRIILDAKKIFFKTNSSQLRPEVKAALDDIGNYLRQIPDGWSDLTISGHADQRGRYKYNLKLSNRRATSVLLAIDPAGTSDPRMHVEAHSYLIPIDPRSSVQAWAKNRRVELVFSDVSDGQELRRRLAPLENLKPSMD